MKHIRLLLPAFLLLTWSPLLAQEDPAEDEPILMVDDEELDEEEDESDGTLEGSADEPSLIDQCRQEAEKKAAYVRPPRKKYPFVEWHGYLRLRSDMFTDADLGTYSVLEGQGGDWVGTSIFLPPLLHNEVNSFQGANFSDKLDGEKEQTVGSANMRLRLSPSIRVADTLRINTRVDVLDNVVFGSTPEYLSQYASPLVPLDTLTGTQRPPVAGVNSFQDSVAVKEAYAVWDLGIPDEDGGHAFSLGTITAGRFAYHWGLGLSSHSGDYLRDDTSLTPLERFRALDSEGANYLDRITWRHNFGPLSLMAGYGMLSSGPTSRVAYDASAQVYDIEEKDDVRQIEFGVYSRPETRHDFVTRRKQLFTGSPVFDWGLYVTYRMQDMSTQWAGVGDAPVTYAVGSYGNWALADRTAWVVTPDLWLRLDWRPDPRTRFYAGFEGVMVYGRVENSGGLGESAKLDLMQYGAALETNYTTGAVSFGFDWGMASGDTGEMIGAYRGSNTPWGGDSSHTAFSFNRNYFVDMLLYREVIGSVTNTAYFKPHFDFDVIPTEQNSFGGAISAMYAITMEPEAYAGNNRNLGLEFDALAYYEEANQFMTTVGFGVMFPFAALDRPKQFLEVDLPGKEAEWAWTFQGNLFLVF